MLAKKDKERNIKLYQLDCVLTNFFFSALRPDSTIYSRCFITSTLYPPPYIQLEIKIASGLLNSRSFIFKRKRVKPPHKRSKLRLLIDIYKDYKALGKNIPLSRAGLFKIKRKKGINFYNSGMTARDESTVPLSRRQRLMGLARNTRDNYIPKITGSVSSFASGASRAFTNTIAQGFYNSTIPLVY